MTIVKDLGEMPESIGGVSAEERETIIRKDHVDGKAHICTTDFVEYGRLMRKCRENPAKWKAVGYETCGGEAQAGYFECPAKLVGYRGGKEREVSEEQRAASSERIKALLSAQKAAREARKAAREKGGE